MNRCLFVLFLSTAIAAAHSDNRVFPFYQLTDEMLEQIDIHDGSVEEWHEIGEPSMTLLDFQTVGNFIPPDPSNLDARIWLAWHDDSNRIYSAFVIIDDTYHNTHGYENDVVPGAMYWSDSVIFSIDADHSGGLGRSQGVDYTDAERMSIYGMTQRYTVIAETESGPTLDNQVRENQLSGDGIPTSWKVYPPYGDAGGMAAGENPTLSVIEMYVTPYDSWGDWEDKKKTEFTELSAHQIIGFVIMISDNDDECDDCTITNFWFPTGIDFDGPEFTAIIYNVADIFLDGILLPVQATTVESITWGRIKASLQP